MADENTTGRRYEDEQYYEEADQDFDNGFSNYDRLLLELNGKMYYPEESEVYEKILNECGLDHEATYNKNTDHAKILEATYSILHTLLGNIDAYRKIETEFVTQGEAFTALQNRLKFLRAEIDKVKAEMHYQDSDFSFMYYNG